MSKYCQVLFCLLLLAIFSPALAEVKFASDITRLGVGARPLGMGKMFTGLSDDISAMYLNPAGLGTLKAPQGLTMSGQFVNLVNYLTLAGIMPTDVGMVGAGFTSAGIGFSTPVLNLVEIASGEYRVIPSTTEAVNYNYNNSALAFTYGGQLPWPEFSAGATFKLFSENISGNSSGNAQGMDLDLGLLYRPADQYRLGATIRNVLPATMGGKIKWNTGLEEAIPSTLILGGSYRLESSGVINLGADYEIQPTQQHIPGLLHLGAEYWPVETFAFRAGIDQDVIGSGTGIGLNTSSNPTAGLSLFFADWRFDYAFHKYNDIPTNDTHYFSLAWLQPLRIPLQLLSPPDKTITHESTVLVRGKVTDRKIKRLEVNGTPVQINNGLFETEVSLMLGKNTVWVAAFDGNNNILDSKRARVLRLEKYSDVQADYWARLEIEQLGTLNIMPGYRDGTYKPEEKSKRVDYLYKLMNIGKVPPATSTKGLPFLDIKPKDKIAPYVQAGYQNKLIKGYPDRKFRPWQIINRVEGTVMTVRFSNLNLAEVNERPYQDIDARHWAIREITAAKQENMLKFALEYLYPKEDIRRAELAAMLVRTPPVRPLVEELMDFETGYTTAYPVQKSS